MVYVGTLAITLSPIVIVSSRVFSLSVVLSVLEPAPVGVPVGVGHVPDSVPLAVLVLSDVSVAVGPVILPGAMEQTVANLSYVPEVR